MSATQILFDEVQYSRLLASNFKFLEIISTGNEIEVEPDIYKREIVLVAHKTQPRTSAASYPLHYYGPINDTEFAELASTRDYVVSLIR